VLENESNCFCDVPCVDVKARARARRPLVGMDGDLLAVENLYNYSQINSQIIQLIEIQVRSFSIFRSCIRIITPGGGGGKR